MLETQTTRLLKEMDAYLKEEAHKIVEPLYTNANGKPTKEQIENAEKQYVEAMLSEVDEHVSLTTHSSACYSMIREYLRATNLELKIKLKDIIGSYRLNFQSENYPFSLKAWKTKA